MDLQITPEQKQLQDELHEWLVANLPWEYGTEPPTRSLDLAQVVELGRQWQAQLAAHRARRAGPRSHRELRSHRGDGPGPGPRVGGPDRDQPGGADLVRPRIPRA